MTRFRAKYVPTAFATSWKKTDEEYYEVETQTPRFLELLYKFGDESGSEGGMQMEFEAEDGAQAPAVFQERMQALVRADSELEIGLVKSESVPFRNGWYIVGGPGGGLLYLGAPIEKGGEPRIIRDRMTVDYKTTVSLYAFLILSIEEIR